MDRRRTWRRCTTGACGGGGGRLEVQHLATQRPDGGGGGGGGLWLSLRNGALLRQAAAGGLEVTVLQTHTALQANRKWTRTES